MLGRVGGYSPHLMSLAKGGPSELAKTTDKQGLEWRTIRKTGPTVLGADNASVPRAKRHTIAAGVSAHDSGYPQYGMNLLHGMVTCS